MAYRNTFFRWLFLYSLTFGLTYVLKLFTYLCPETGQGLHQIPGIWWSYRTRESFVFKDRLLFWKEHGIIFQSRHFFKTGSRKINRLERKECLPECASRDKGSFSRLFHRTEKKGVASDDYRN